MGRKNDFTFRMVLTDSHNSTKSGRFLEVVGTYNPKSKAFAIKEERVKHWMSHGAQVTPTLHNLFITHKVIEGKKINVLPKKSAPKAPAPEVVAASAEEAKDVAAAPAAEEAVEVVAEAEAAEEVAAEEEKKESPPVEAAVA